MSFDVLFITRYDVRCQELFFAPGEDFEGAVVGEVVGRIVVEMVIIDDISFLEARGRDAGAAGKVPVGTKVTDDGAVDGELFSLDIAGAFAFWPIVMMTDDAPFLSKHGGVNFKIFRDVFGEDDIALGNEAKLMITGAIEIDEIFGNPDVSVIGVEGEAGGDNGGLAV